MRITWRLTFITAALAIAYYFLVGAVMGRLPWVLVPSWWRHAWPSPHAAVFAWFQALEIVGALVAALPVSVAIALFVKQYQYGVTLAAAAAPAAFIISDSLVSYLPASGTYGTTTDLWLTSLISFVALCGSPPLLVWVSRALPSNNHWRGP